MALALLHEHWATAFVSGSGNVGFLPKIVRAADDGLDEWSPFLLGGRFSFSMITTPCVLASCLPSSDDGMAVMCAGDGFALLCFLALGRIRDDPVWIF